MLEHASDQARSCQQSYNFKGVTRTNIHTTTTTRDILAFRDRTRRTSELIECEMDMSVEVQVDEDEETELLWRGDGGGRKENK